MTSEPEQDNFSNVSWSEQANDPTTISSPPAEQPGHTLDGPGTNIAHDTHRLGSERLECVVDTPIKENDGTKDAFVSYLITTSVRFLPPQRPNHSAVLLLTHK